MKHLIEKARILMEALPYIKTFYGHTIVIKYGGHAMVDESLKESFAKDVVMLKYIGINPVIVHGGGPQIGQMLKLLGKEAKFVQGIRVTDRETMDVVEMVLGGKINKEIVAGINRFGGRAIGLSGKDGNLIIGRKMEMRAINPQTLAPEIIDVGLAGEVEKINPEIVSFMDRGNFIPVIAPVGCGADGETFNINADLVAGEVAAALKAEKLILLTDVEGVKDREGRLISRLDTGEISAKIADGTITGGMIPKLNCCLKALRDGVRKVHIIDGRVEHACLLEIFTDHGIGTEITQGVE
ncbi:MAG: acetylglutamate kinase [Desulfuromonadaceae bacterium]|nr:acetylglutamate kinase [Desulfuromonadaceae bacterium]